MKSSPFIVRWLLRALFVFAIAPFAIAWPSPAFAEPIDLNADVDASEIELGDTVTYTLQATSTTSESPSDPKLTMPSGFTLVDRNASPTHMVSIINGRASEKHGLTASWTLRSDRLGAFMIGPASLSVGRTRQNARALRVVVVAPGSGHAKPKRPSRGPFGGGGSPFDPFGGGGSPFDPFKGLIPGMPDEPPDPFGGLNADPKLGLDAPRAPTAFLHATIDKTRAVVGEQVVLTVYLYEDLRARQTQPTDVHEATATDFVKRSLLQDETRAVHIGNAIVGGHPWSVRLVRKNALFPIKAGQLSIAPMSLTLQGRLGLRESETLAISVVDPPTVGRPPGYQLGDTGDFSLSATLSPRAIDQHGAVGVTIEMRGSGNMPSKLPTPEVAGVEWLEPQVQDSLGPMSSDVFGGTRTFSYVVRVHEAGAIDLGNVRVPYFDPRTRAYNIAHAELGIVQVTKVNARSTHGDDEKEPVLPGLPNVQKILEGKLEASFLTERPLFWAALFGSPVACVAGIGALALLRRERARRANAAPSPERIARERRSAAESAIKGDDGRAAAAAVARSVEAEVLASTGLNLRGTSGAAAMRELIEAGAPEDAARTILDVLSACEDARFSPHGVPIDDVRALWKRASEALDVASVAAKEGPSSVAPRGSGVRT